MKSPVSTPAQSPPVTPLTDEQKRDHNPEFVLLDPRPISPERWREIAKWHDTFHPVAQEDLPLEEEWQRVNDLINALEDSREALRIAEMRADLAESGTAECTAENARLSRLLEEERAKLVPGSPTERYPTVWAYEMVCAALDSTKKCLEEERRESGRVMMANSGLGELLGEVMFSLSNAWIGDDWQAVRGILDLLEAKSGPKAEAAAPCQRDCQKCGPAVGLWGGICRCTVAPPEYREGDTHCATCKLPFVSGGAGVGLQGEEGGGRG